MTEKQPSIDRPRYDDLVEHSFGLICQHDMDGVLTWVNPAIARLLGREREEMIGRSLEDFLADRSYLAPYLQNVTDQGEDRGWFEALTADGESRYLQFHNVLITADDDSRFVLGHAQDVTALIETETQLTAAKEEVEQVLAGSPAIIYSTEAKPDYTATYISPNVFELLGYRPEEFHRRGFWLDHVHPDDRERVLEGLERLLQFGDNEHEYRFLHVDGTYRWMGGRERLVRNDQGDPVAITGQWSDLTDAKKLHEELDRFFSTSLGLLCIRTRDGFFKRVNPAFEEVLGHDVRSLLSSPIRDFMHPDDVAATETQLLDLVAGSPRITYEDRWRCADDSYRTLSWSAIPSVDGSLIYAVARDVTAENERAKALRHAMVMAREANTAKSEFLANMSHEIRTPMNGIIGMTELTLDTTLTDQQREYLQMVQSSAAALLDTINSILDFSKIEAGRMDLEKIDFTLWETVTGALKPLALTARSKGVELLYDEGPNVPERLRGDPGRLRQALVNLAGNAVKFTEQGFVRLTVHRVESSGKGIRLRFGVSDTGIGIPNEKIQHIFGSFNQVDGSMSRRFGGTGLGLAITSGLVEMMGGRVNVESEEGKGSTFSFEAAFGEATLERRPTAPVGGDLRGLRALAVDDHEANRLILVEFTKRMEMETIAAASGEEALAALDDAHKEGRPIDIAVLDCHMPGMGGFELAERIRADERFRDLVLVAFTAAGQPGDGARCEELGISSYLLKPLAPPELRDALLLTLEKGREPLDQGELVTRHSLRESRMSLKVLLAEDNLVNQRLAIHTLERFGHTVHLATTGLEAVAAWEKDDYDVILMDIQMPEMDGTQATTAIREREAELGTFTPIVAMTAHAMVGDRERFLAVGMNDYISKPISRDRLREVLRGIRHTDDPVVEPASVDIPGEAGSLKVSFEHDVLMERTDSDHELIRMLVDVFESDRDKLLGDIEEALSADDADALERAARTIKGALGVFGAEVARARAEKLEMTARDGAVSEGREQYPDLRNQVIALEADLKKFVAELGTA